MSVCEILDLIAEDMDDNDDFGENDLIWYLSSCRELTTTTMLDYARGEVPDEHLYPLLAMLYTLDAGDELLKLAYRFANHPDENGAMIAAFIIDVNDPYRGIAPFWRALAAYCERQMKQQPAYQLSLF